MHVTEVLARLGGVADAGSLTSATSRRKIKAALRSGDIVRVGRGGYALPIVSEGLRAAQSLQGVLSGPSAAAFWGWELKQPPERPHVTVPYKRNVPAARRVGIDVRWRDLPAADVHDGRVTLPGQTIITCARELPFDEALAIADSALRHGSVTKDELLLLGGQLTRGRVRVLRVVEAADAEAANPFESVLRAITLDVPGLDVRAQVVLDDRGFRCRPDLVDVARKIVVEAESFAFHSSRSSLLKDCRRYTALTIRGWRVVRFCWEDVMFRPEYVRLALVSLIDPGSIGTEQQVLLASGA